MLCIVTPYIVINILTVNLYIEYYYYYYCIMCRDSCEICCVTHICGLLLSLLEFLLSVLQ